MNRKSIFFRVCFMALSAGLALTALSVLVAQASRHGAVSPSTETDASLQLPGTITGIVTYTGAVTGTHMVWVGAFTTTHGGPPAHSTMRSGLGVYTITGVPEGVYYIMAGMDADDSGGAPDPAIDPLGSYAYNPVIVTEGALISGTDIMLLDPTPPSTDTGSIGGWISYTGVISSAHNIIVVALREGDPGPPSYSTVIFGPGPYTITHMADYTYTVLAFIDLDDDMGPPELDEPIGWYDPGSDGNPDPVIVSGGNAVTGVNIALRDRYHICLPLVMKVFEP